MTTQEQSLEYKIRDFMLKAGQDCPIKLKEVSDEIKFLRAKLILEEWKELLEAMGIRSIDEQVVDWEPSLDSNLVEVADALADLLYVVVGTAVAFGLKLEPIFEEVHRSNMSKFIDGYRRGDGKWVKGPSYSPANLEPLIKEQLNSSPDS